MRNIWIIGSVSRLNFSNKSQKKSRLFRYSRDLARISARSIDLDMNEETEMTYIVYVISPQILECRNGHILLLPIRFDCVIHKDRVHVCDHLDKFQCRKTDPESTNSVPWRIPYYVISRANRSIY